MDEKKNSPGGGGEGYSCFPGGVQSLFLRNFFIKLNWVFKGDPTPIRAWNNLHGNYLIYMVRSLLLTLNQNTLQHQTCGLWCTRHRRHRAKSLKVTTGSGRDQKDVHQKVRTQLWINKKNRIEFTIKTNPDIYEFGNHWPIWNSCSSVTAWIRIHEMSKF